MNLITRDPDEFLENFHRIEPDYDASLPRGVMMVMPEQFYVEQETAEDNVYLNQAVQADSQLALAQAEALANLIESAGVPVKRFSGMPDQPDGVFSNNAFATVPGAAVIGRMAFPRRQTETQRADIRQWLEEENYVLRDLSQGEAVAELTGALVLDRARRVGFCGMSGRVDEAGVAAMHEALGLRLTYAFDLSPGEYHTNVVLSVLIGRSVVFEPHAFADRRAPGVLANAYPGHSISLSQQEKNDFAGNCIALTDRDLFLSQRAEEALGASTRHAMEAQGFTLHSTDLSQLELAGGSLRCMVTELF